MIHDGRYLHFNGSGHINNKLRAPAAIRKSCPTAQQPFLTVFEASQQPNIVDLELIYKNREHQ
eukprot:scaffold305537_cov30-Cyclotella_meneghiniana.AAC.1